MSESPVEKARRLARRRFNVVGHKEVHDFKDALGVNKSIRIRQAECTALSKTENTCTLKIGGRAAVSGVPYFDVLPCPTYSVWAATDGEDIWVMSSMGPAASARVCHTGTQNHTNTGNEQAVDWQNPMPSGSPGNGGWDFWGTWDSGQSTRLGIPAPGLYNLNANISFAANNAGRRYIVIRRFDTGNDIAREDEHTLTNTIVSMTANQLYRVSDATGIDFQVQAFQNSGGNLGYQTVGGSVSYSPMLSWAWLGSE